MKPSYLKDCIKFNIKRDSYHSHGYFNMNFEYRYTLKKSKKFLLLVLFGLDMAGARIKQKVADIHCWILQS